MIARTLFLLLALTAPPLLSGLAHAVTLGTNSVGQFTIDGTPTFLVGVSYYDALDWHRSDLDAFHARGFNLIRIMLDKEWLEMPGVESIFNSDGTLRATQAQRVHDLIEYADGLGMAVDVTILYADQDGRNSAVWLATLAARRAAIQNAVAEFAVHTNVLFDVVNEHNGGSFSDSETAEMNLYMASARAGSSTALLTYSSADAFGDHLLNTADDTAIASGISAELANGVQILTPHTLRDSQWFSRSGKRANALKEALAALGHPEIPIYFQEEDRRGADYVDSSAAEFLQAAADCKVNGCAAWIFHTAAGFNLSGTTFMSQLHSVESEVMDTLVASLTSPPPLPPDIILPPHGIWPNEPSDTTVILDCPFSNSLCGMWDRESDHGGPVAYATDPTAPLSPSTVIAEYMAANATGGTGGRFGITLPTVQREVYIGTWWKTNADFEGYVTNNNKLFFLLGYPAGNNLLSWNGQPNMAKQIVWYNQTPENNCHVPTWYGACGDGKNQASGWFTGNTGATAWLTAGSGWHRLETYHKASTTATSQDGVIKVWVDNVLVADYTNLNYSPGGFYEFQYNATWDGQPASTCAVRDCSKAWHHYWDHLRISAKRDGSASTGTPPSTPGAVKGLTVTVQ